MKNKKLSNFTNYKMDSEVYKLRRKVINLIYELKNEGFNLPRVDVRVGESKKCNVLGMAVLKDNIIWITEKAINKNEDYLRNVVYHELLHAIYGCDHDKQCPIMSPTLDKVINKNDCIKVFKKYYNKYNKTKQLEVA